MSNPVFDRIMAKIATINPDKAALPGSELKKLLAAFGVIPAKGCNCAAWATMMNARGLAWCRANVALLAQMMTREAQQRGWPLPERLMGAGARSLVRLAIWRSSRTHQKK